MPPMLGLQLIAPMEDMRLVTRATRAPIRVAAAAASQPAWPPPMTTRSKREFGGMREGRNMLVRGTRIFDGRRDFICAMKVSVRVVSFALHPDHEGRPSDESQNEGKAKPDTVLSH